MWLELTHTKTPSSASVGGGDKTHPITHRKLKLTMEDVIVVLSILHGLEKTLINVHEEDTMVT